MRRHVDAVVFVVHDLVMIPIVCAIVALALARDLITGRAWLRF